MTFRSAIQPGGYVSAAPLPSPDALMAFYAEQYYQNPQSSTYQEGYEPLELHYKRLRCDALLRALRDAGVSGGEFLDVGAGEGFLLNAARVQGFSVSGIDFSSFAVKKFFPDLSDRLKAGDIYETINQLIGEGAHFDACALINVLEHVIDPAAMLASIGKVLSPAGILAITVPNDYSILQRLLQSEKAIDREFWFCPPDHLHYFNAENLPLFCAANGYRLIDAFSDFPIDLYLLHPGSNYFRDRLNGPSAHRARMLHDVMISASGIEKYLAFYRAMFAVGAGRNVTVLLQRIAA